MPLEGAVIQRLLVPPPARVNAELLRSEIPSIEIAARGGRPRLHIDVREWEIGDPDLVALDIALGDAGGAEPVTISLEGAGDVTRAALAVLTRLQWGIPARNPSLVLARLRDRHRDLHDLTFALVHADWVHALDTQAWAARLEPGASLAVLVAALFHDVERLVDEKETRLDHLAHDYDAFRKRMPSVAHVSPVASWKASCRTPSWSGCSRSSHGTRHPATTQSSSW